MPASLPPFEEFVRLPHAVTLLGMSGVGKTTLSTSLRRDTNWFHYSADYRIGTAYLAEYILDNIKFRIMRTDAFIADLLRSDSIYINHNISVDNLEPVSTYLGMYGDPAKGGLAQKEFLLRQEQYRDAERRSMRDVPRFLEKSWQIYTCKDFINDASGSLCEIVNFDDPNDRVISTLRDNSLIIYIRANAASEQALRERAEQSPKPLFYFPKFISHHLEDMPKDGLGVDPKDFAREMFPKLLENRKPRYDAFAEKFGFTIDVDHLFPHGINSAPMDSEKFYAVLYEILQNEADNDLAGGNLDRYLRTCYDRAASRGMDI